MYLLPILCYSLSASCCTNTLAENNENQLKYEIKHKKVGNIEGEDRSGSNSSYYSTREMRDACLEEWAGKTQEVKEYFDQLPSKEFKENSEDLKMKFYYERKGLEDVDSTQVFNVTPKINYPTGPEKTIEVNESYVPKYRITTSEEIRMEDEGTFYRPSEADSSDSSETSLITQPTGMKQKQWPPHMDPKDRRIKKKKRKLDAEQMRRKEFVEKKISVPNKVGVKKKKLKLDTPQSKKHNGAKIDEHNVNKNKKYEGSSEERKNVKKQIKTKKSKEVESKTPLSKGSNKERTLKLERKKMKDNVHSESRKKKTKKSSSNENKILNSKVKRLKKKNIQTKRLHSEEISSSDSAQKR